MNSPDVLTDAAELRHRAEQRLHQSAPEEFAPDAGADAGKLLHELQVCQIELEMQNEELRRARTEMDAVLTRYTELYDFAPTGYFTLDRDGIVRQSNFASAKLLGIERGKLDGKHFENLVESNDRAVFSDFMGRVFAGQGKEICDLALACADNTSCLLHIEAGADETGQACRMTVTDITEFHAAQQQLARQLQQIENAKREWEGVLDSVSDPVFLHDREMRVVRANRAYAEKAGRPFRDIIGQPYWQMFPKLDAPLPGCPDLTCGETQVELPGGETYHSSSYPVPNAQGDFVNSVHVMEDITERKRMEQNLLESEEKFRQISATAQDAILMMDSAGRIVFWNNAAEKMFGYAKEEALGKELHALIVPERFRAAFAEKFPAFSATGQGAVIGKIMELAAIRKDETEFPVELSVSAAKLNGQRHAVGFIRDISERKQAEQAVQHANRAFRTLSAGNHELVHASDEMQLLQAMCRVIVEDGGYHSAWVGYKQNDAEKSVRTMAQSGFEAGFVEALQITWADNEHGRGPTGKAVRSGATQVVQDVASDPDCAPWRERALQHGYASGIALPLHSDNDVFGCLTIYAAQANAFDPEEVALLEEMSGDLAFGIHMLRLREKQKQQTVLLRKSLEGTVLAIAGMVEMRDPYTAGHQVRVAGLAVAIARQMGLSAEKVHGIHLAGTVHDLGKIQVPAEILSKPGKLSDIEYSLIKAHPQAGYDILKDIDFPWPIAQIVLQHHERMDGSGYPQGLRGDAILPEARIIAVADVVEAMSSHRPYRPGLGIEAALAEITKNCGTWYDPQAVDTCLSLFRDKAYQFA